MAICMVLPRGESAAVLGGTDAEGLDEGAAHGLGGAVTAGAGGLLDPVVGVLQAAGRGLDPDLGLVTAGGRADLGGERAGKLPGREVRPEREGLDGQGLGWVLGDPLLHVPDRLPGGGLGL